MLTFVLLHLFLQFVWPISLNWQLNFPVWINMQCCYAIFHCCKVHVKLVLFHLQSIFATIVGLCTYSSNPTMLLLVEKKMFLSQNLPCIKTHTNTLLFTGSCWVSHGMIIVSRGSMFFLTCCLRKTFPLRLNIEKTLCSQSHMPASHLTTTAAYWKSMATKKNLWHQIFSVPGENYVHNITKHLVYPFLPRTDNTGFGACSRK